MKDILSIQSHVAFGYVGNRAAAFPLQRLGHDVTVINTVQFSNHTGYGKWTGDIFSPTHIQDIINGIGERKPLDQFDAILSGYLGDEALGKIIINTVQEAKKTNPELIYCCDPVLGDVGRGIFVKESVADFLKNEAINQADIVTPNQFELNYLTSMKTSTLHEILKACEKLRAKGPRLVLVTSVLRPEIPFNRIEMMLDSAEGTWAIQSNRLEFDIPPNGAGDATAAIFLAKYLEKKHIEGALEHAMSAIYAIFKTTHTANTRELQLIASQDDIVAPKLRLQATRIR